jgi:hypothetical protein
MDTITETTVETTNRFSQLPAARLAAKPEAPAMRLAARSSRATDALDLALAQQAKRAVNPILSDALLDVLAVSR